MKTNNVLMGSEREQSYFEQFRGDGHIEEPAAALPSFSPLCPHCYGTGIEMLIVPNLDGTGKGEFLTLCHRCYDTSGRSKVYLFL